jgi:hypothetical protein
MLRGSGPVVAARKTSRFKPLRGYRLHTNVQARLSHEKRVARFVNSGAGQLNFYSAAAFFDGEGA